MYGIRRIDNQDTRTHAWLVTIQRRNRITNRYVCDSLYGGRKRAPMRASHLPQARYGVLGHLRLQRKER
jgi:hypothetical protein